MNIPKIPLENILKKKKLRKEKKIIREKKTVIRKEYFRHFTIR